MKENNEPQVTVMGEDISATDTSSRSGDIIWGLFVLTAGIILLLNFMDMLSWDFWSYIWRFWPVLLILAGLHIIVGNSIVARALMAIVTLLFFLFVIAVGIKLTGSSVSDRFPAELNNLINRWEEIRNEQ